LKRAASSGVVRELVRSSPGRGLSASSDAAERENQPEANAIVGQRVNFARGDGAADYRRVVST
jgi:hypothetical protein